MTVVLQMQLLEEGKTAQVPVLLGTNKNEGTEFISHLDLQANQVSDKMPDKLYEYRMNVKSIIRQTNDRSFGCVVVCFILVFRLL